MNDKLKECNDRAEAEENMAVQSCGALGGIAELGALLDKNPEVARILDLIEEVGR